jgi:alpha-beta hydrolase superfamily lysophospholipase
LIEKDFSFKGTSGKELHATRYSPPGTPAGTAGIIHGMAEHRRRYEDFARELVSAGYSVYTYDQTGHGETALKSDDPLGHVPVSIGWKGLTDDAAAFLEAISSKEGDVPVYVFGHSMGSFVARSLITEYGEKVDGAVLSGTSRVSKAELSLLKSVAKLERWIKGEVSDSYLMEKLLFSSHNSEFEPADTPFDWLSRDEEAVENYLKDELSGFNCTTGFYEVFVSGMENLAGTAEAGKIRKDLPILFISGENDPVGGEDVLDLAEEYVEAGLKKVESKVYPGARHELIKETNSDEVIKDVINWLERHQSQ